MKALGERKQLLLYQADLHRQLLAFECGRLRSDAAEARDRLTANRWWLIAGGVIGGWLLTRRLPQLIRWAPTVMPLWPVVRDMLRP